MINLSPCAWEKITDTISPSGKEGVIRIRGWKLEKRQIDTEDEIHLLANLSMIEMVNLEMWWTLH